MQYTLRIRLKNDEWFFGPGVARLLNFVESEGGVNPASAKMKMAYSKACRILNTAERELGFPLLERKKGGLRGGGSVLTEAGRDFLNRYLAFEKECYKTADELYQKHFGDLEPK